MARRADNDSEAPLGSPERPGLWQWLAQQADFARERPRRRTDLECTQFESARLGSYYVLKNPARGSYLKLAPEDHFLFSRMDGEHTVRDLLLAYYREFGSLAFSRVLGLIRELKEGGFLHQEQPRLMSYLRRRCARRDWLGRLAALGQAVLHKELAIGGIGHWVEALYRAGGWLFATAGARVLYVFVVAAGLVLFVRELTGGGFTLVAVEDSYLLGGVVLALLQLAVIFIHEHAHALTTVHFGRQVTRGGFMLYLGLPAFFVDTSDIWMAPKKARLAVSWAGPFSELILGGATSIVVWYVGPSPVGNVLFKFALLLYLGAFLNLNPLLELDGYYLLMDWLEVPMLRGRSFRFIRDKLLRKLIGRERFTGEERLFAWFGLLSLGYTAFALATAFYIYFHYALGAVGSLWRTHGWFVRALIVAGYAALVGPLGYLVVIRVLRGLRAAVRWMRERDVFDDPYRLAAAAVLLALLVWYLPGRLAPNADLVIYGVLLGAALALLAVGSGLLARWYDDPAPRLAAALFAGWAGVLLLAQVLVALGRRPEGATAFTASWVLFLASGVAGWWVASAFRVRPGDLVLAAVVAALSALVGWRLVPVEGEGEGASAWLFLGPACASLGLGFLTVVGRAYRGTVLALAVGLGWCGRCLGVLAVWWWVVGERRMGTGSSALLPAVFGASLLVGGVVLVRLAYGHLARARLEARRAPALSDAERLADAFTALVGTVLAQFQALSGRRVVEALGEELGQREDFPRSVSITGTRTEVTVSPADSILVVATRLRRALEQVLDGVRRYLRDAYLARLVRQVFRELSWDEREAASQYLLRGESWQGALAESHRAAAQSYAGLLGQNPVFAELTEEELSAVAGRLRPERRGAGSVIVRQGERGDIFYLIARGRVAVVVESRGHGPQEVAELTDGDYFGEIALLRETTRTATCVARTDVELLTLSRADFTELLARQFAVAGKVEKVAGMSAMLRRMPLFNDFSPRQLQALLRCLGGERAAAGSTVVRAGEPGERFYIIESGLVEVLAAEEGGAAEGAEGQRVVARLGRGEYFGEIALLADVARTATVRAVSDCEFFVLDRKAFEALIRTHVLAGRHLELVSSRRMLDTKRKLVGGTVAGEE